ncbi:hypothetical protein [Streptomyces stelliscabiei]|uniref:hypothetical protein n=1 Tax=Streptomyces stelliscabiei TaxID=146820 RepID=UPI002FF3FB82
MVVEGAGHDSLLINSRYAHQVTDRVLAFFQGVEERARTPRPARSVTLDKETAR